MYSILHCCFVWVKKPYWWHGPIRILSLCDVTSMYIYVYVRITLFFAQSHRNTYEVSRYKKKQHRRITNNFKNRLYLVLYCYSSSSILLSQLTQHTKTNVIAVSRPPLFTPVTIKDDTTGTATTLSSIDSDDNGEYDDENRGAVDANPATTTSSTVSSYNNNTTKTPLFLYVLRLLTSENDDPSKKGKRSSLLNAPSKIL